MYSARLRGFLIGAKSISGSLVLGHFRIAHDLNNALDMSISTTIPTDLSILMNSSDAGLAQAGAL